MPFVKKSQPHGQVFWWHVRGLTVPSSGENLWNGCINCTCWRDHCQNQGNSSETPGEGQARDPIRRRDERPKLHRNKPDAYCRTEQVQTFKKANLNTGRELGALVMGSGSAEVQGKAEWLKYTKLGWGKGWFWVYIRDLTCCDKNCSHNVILPVQEIADISPFCLLIKSSESCDCTKVGRGGLNT